MQMAKNPPAGRAHSTAAIPSWAMVPSVRASADRDGASLSTTERSPASGSRARYARANDPRPSSRTTVSCSNVSPGRGQAAAGLARRSGWSARSRWPRITSRMCDR
ncbi:hypothetical protein [Gemmata sp.]|uniref:hypothetical protein n=1 Tax=Gemmata sp. TaxID=1914242 RepID=UPI003F72D446